MSGCPRHRYPKYCLNSAISHHFCLRPSHHPLSKIPLVPSKLVSLLPRLLSIVYCHITTRMISCMCSPNYATVQLLILLLLLFALRIKSVLLAMAFQTLCDTPLLVSLISFPITLPSLYSTSRPHFCSSKTSGEISFQSSFSGFASPGRVFPLMNWFASSFHSSFWSSFRHPLSCFIFLRTLISWYYVTFVYLWISFFSFVIMSSL